MLGLLHDASMVGYALLLTHPTLLGLFALVRPRQSTFETIDKPAIQAKVVRTGFRPTYWQSIHSVVGFERYDLVAPDSPALTRFRLNSRSPKQSKVSVLHGAPGESDAEICAVSFVHSRHVEDCLIDCFGTVQFPFAFDCCPATDRYS